MKKGINLSLIFVIVLVLSVGFVESQNIKPVAKAAGYHNVLYTGGISNLDSNSPWVSIFNDNLVVGSNPADSLWIYNEPYYGEFVLETSSGNPITVVNDFRVYSTLKAYSYVQAFAYCDIYGANCLNNGQLVNRLNGFYTNISRLQTNVTTLNNRVDNLQTDVTALQTASNVWTQSGANAYYTSTGNVGIGVPAPVHKLDVNSGAVSGYPLRLVTPNGYLLIGPNNNLWSHFSTDRPRFWFSTGVTVETGNIGSYDEDLNLQTSGTTRVTISNANGNVGIGTPAPTQKLDVRGNVNVTGDISVSGKLGFGTKPDALVHINGGSGTQSCLGNPYAYACAYFKTGPSCLAQNGCSWELPSACSTHTAYDCPSGCTANYGQSETCTGVYTCSLFDSVPDTCAEMDDCKYNNYLDACVYDGIISGESYIDYCRNTYWYDSGACDDDEFCAWDIGNNKCASTYNVEVDLNCAETDSATCQNLDANYGVCDYTPSVGSSCTGTPNRICTGTPEPCSAMLNQVDCIEQDSCKWDVPNYALIVEDGNVGIGTDAPLASLKLDVAGKIGAEEYCDRNGQNCFDFSASPQPLSYAHTTFCDTANKIKIVQTNLKYQKIGPLTYVVGTIGFNLDEDMDSLCLRLDGLPKNFVTNASVDTLAVNAFPVATKGYYGSLSKWLHKPGIGYMSRYNDQNILTFKLDNQKFVKSNIAPANPEWIINVNFIY
jgi:outer membrane murein-binding lipoprotein Lpp